MRTFSRLRWIFCCLCGLNHRRGEAWFITRQGHRRRPVSVCTRCGVKPKGMAL